MQVSVLPSVEKLL